MHLLLSTCPSDHAQRLVRALVTEQLVGCGNIVPGVKSIYRWEGELCEDNEVLLLMETTHELSSLATRRLKELHPYETPKLVTIKPEAFDAAFGAWLRSVCQPASNP